MVFVRNKGDYDAYVRTVFAFEASPDWSYADFQRLIHLNNNTTDWTWKWIETPVTVGEGTYYVAVATYNHILPPAAISDISLSQVLMDKTVTNADLQKLGETYTILVNTQAVQADGFTDPETALNESFGPISAEKVPFLTEQPAAGVDMKDALRYLNADGVTDISKQVHNVVFGFEKDYPEMILQNDGIQVQTAQGANAYVYYEQNSDGLYTVYILSSDPVYAPVDSTGLFEKMSALTTVDTSNLDVSQVEVMDRMFYSCEKLQSVDVSDWDTSNVKTTNDMFYRCISVNGLDVSQWDVSNVTSMSGMFDLFGKSQTTTALTYLDVSKWDVSNVTDMSRLFLGCNKLNGLVLKNWDVSNVTNTYAMFYYAKSITELDLSGWQPTNMADVRYMFQGCSNLETIYVSDLWTNAGMTSSNYMFSGCGKLTGGAGTKVSNVNATNARIDLPAVTDAEGNVITPAVPGYLTHINDKPVTENP